MPSVIHPRRGRLRTVGVLGCLIVWLLVATTGTADDVPQPASSAETPEDEIVEPMPDLGTSRGVLEYFGISQSDFEKLADGEPWRDEEEETLLRVMYQLHRDITPLQVHQWTQATDTPGPWVEDPVACHGNLYTIVGRVKRVERLEPLPEVTERFEMEAYYRCELTRTGSDRSAVVFAREVPSAWRDGFESESGEAVSADGIFLKRCGPSPSNPTPALVATRLRWHGDGLLGRLGMDLGLFDQVRATGQPDQDGQPRQRMRDMRLSVENRDCFHELLAAAGRSDPGQLLGEARQILKRSGDESFSVVPLFNEPQTQHGRLVFLSGTARQVVPVEVTDAAVRKRLGIERYYQIFLFPPDSLHNPVVFCVRDLPPNLPVGDGPTYGEHISVAGFFFNTWVYHNRAGPGQADTSDWQLAPLLIGRDCQWHPASEATGHGPVGIVAGGLFVVVLLAVWLILWRAGRGDRKFYEDVLAEKISPEPVESLDKLDLPQETEPDFNHLREEQDSP